jgi:hypothetical protein
MNGYATFMGGPIITMTYADGSNSILTQIIKNALAEGIKLMMSAGKGALPVGQFDAQKLLPNGRGIPSLASSV